ncbi:hypothetical protein PR001_g24411 [Phytophthora rubi]|uniref:Uncharacterized protein n=1 Tax=Phytophthora rubi TaxID=129364 RepID=A0A6A3IAC7_9STRA|nr:hypothetical protein PR001_g24411 [Phytophthora rubi]
MELCLNDMALADGFVPFYEAIGSSLKFLRIDCPPFGGPQDVNVNTIIRSCPNLQELTLSRALVDLEFDLRSYRASNTPIPELNIPWFDVVQLAKDLSDPNHELTKCVRRLRASIETFPLPMADAEPFIPPPFQVSVDSLLSMLEANERLEYVRVQAVDTEPLADFIKHDMKPIYRQFPIKCKAALLSVTQSRDMQVEGGKRERWRRSRRSLHSDR